MTSLFAPSVDAVLTVLVPLLDEVPEAKDVHAGWWYLVVFGALIVAVFLLWRSMRKQISKITFDEKAAPPKNGPDRRDDGPA